MVEKLITGIVLCRKRRGKIEWFLARAKDKKWELPKELVRRGESSVGAAIRFLGEELGIRARVLEEAGRTISKANGSKDTSQKLIFYLMSLTDGDFQKSRKVEEARWLPFAAATRNLALERERKVLRQANNVFKAWEKARKD